MNPEEVESDHAAAAHSFSDESVAGQKVENQVEDDGFTKGAFVVFRFGGTMFLFFLFFAYVNFSVVGWKAWRVNLLALVMLTCLCVALFYGSQVSRWILVAFTAYMGYRMLGEIDFQDWYSSIVCGLCAYLFMLWTYRLIFSRELSGFMAAMSRMKLQK